MELKKDYTIVMVTHNMQQATRISDKTAFFLLGEVVEFDDTDKLFSMPSNVQRITLQEGLVDYVKVFRKTAGGTARSAYHTGKLL